MIKPAVLFLAFAAGFGGFLFWEKRARGAVTKVPLLSAGQKTSLATTSSPAAPMVEVSSSFVRRVPTVEDSPSANADLYLQHLSNSATNVQTLQNGAETQAEADHVNAAWAELSKPVDTLTAQKDLNVLGAKPALTEDGVMGPKTREAIISFQSVMDVPQSGVMDAQTSNALRRAVVAVTSQGALA